MIARIDAHLHLVPYIAGQNGKGRLNALGNGEAIWDDGTKIKLLDEEFGTTNFTMEAAIKVMDHYHIAQAVLLQGSLNGYHNYYSYQAVKAFPDRFVAAFSVDPHAEFAMKIVKRHVEDLGFRIIKFEISQGGGLSGFHRPLRLDADPKCLQIFHYLSAYPGFVVTVDYGSSEQLSYQPEAIAHLAQIFPTLDFVVCHLSFPNNDHSERLKNALELFEPQENIYTDLSAIQDIEGEVGLPFTKCEQDVLLAKKILGAKRLLWGSDAPWSATFNAYQTLSTWLDDSGIFTPEELADVMAKNAKQVYFKAAIIAAMKNATDPKN